MAIALRGSAAVPTGNPTTSFTVAIDAAVVTDDVLFLVVTSRDSTGAGTLAVTDNDTGGNAWTKIGNSTDHKATLWYKRATSGTASKTVTVANAVGSASGVLKAFSGASKVAAPYGDIVVETNASADETHAGFTPSGTGSMVCCSVHNYANDNAVTNLSFATLGATTATEKQSTGGSDCATIFGHVLQSAGPTATGDLTWTQTDGTTYSITWTIMPEVAIAAPAGSVAVSGQVPALLHAIAASVGALTIIGQSVGVAFGAPPTGEIAITGAAPTVNVGQGTETNIPVPAGSLALTGQGPVLGFMLPPGFGQITISGLAPLPAQTLAVPAGSVALSGAAPSLAFVLPPGVGSVALSGQAPNIGGGTQIGVPVGAITLSGHAPALAHVLPLPTGSVALNGVAPTSTVAGPGTNLPAGAVALIGQSVGVAFGAPPTGAIALTGNAPAVVVSGANITAQLEVGSIGLVGTTPTPDSTGLVIRYRASLYSTGNATSYATSATYTPQAESLLVAFVCVGSTEQAAAPTVSGHGVSWTALSLANHLLSSTHRIDVYVANAGASPTSAAFTVSGFGSNRTGCTITEFEVRNASLSGGVTSAVVQKPTNNGTGTSGSVTLAAATAARNRPISFFAHLANEVSNAQTNWTLETGARGNFNTPATSAIGQFRNDAFETTASSSWSTSSAWRGVALEIAVADTGIPAGSIGLSGLAPSLKRELAIPVGSVALSGAAPTLSFDSGGAGQIPTGAIAVTGQSVGVGFGAPATGAITITGQAPTLSSGSSAGTISPPAGAIALSGNYIDVLFLGPDTGVITFTGHAPLPIAGWRPGAGSIAITGLAPTPARGIGLPAGSMSVSGALAAPSVLAGLSLPAGQIVVTGLAPSLKSVVPVAVGAVTLAGQTSAVAASGFVAIPAGSIAFTGLAPQTIALLSVTPGVGSVAITGQAPSLAAAIALPVGGVALQGTAPLLAPGNEIPSGAIALLTQPPVVSRGVPLPAAAIAVTGIAPVASVGHRPSLPAGSLTLVAHTPTAPVGTGLPPGSIVVSGLAPALARGVAIPVGVVTLSGLAPSLTPAVFPGAGSLALSGLAPSIAGALAIPAGDVSVVGRAPSAVNASPLAIPAGSIALSSVAPNISASVGLPAGTLTLVGHAVEPVNGVSPTLSPQVGAVSLSGLATTLHHGHAIPAGTIAVEGAAPGLHTTVAQPAGQLTLSGAPPTATLGVVAILPAGSITVGGAAPSLAVSIGIPVGTIALTGEAPQLVTGVGVIASPQNAALVLTGTAPSMETALGNSPGAITLTGQPPSLTGAPSIPAGLITLAGQAPSLQQALGSQLVQPGAGSLTLTGQAPSILRIERVSRRWLRRSAHLFDELKRIRHNEFKLVMETGVGTATVLDPEVSLRWSDDGGHTWSEYHPRAAGPKGAFKQRVIWRRLGMARTRVYEVSGTDAVKVVLIDAYLNPKKGEH
jgi:hypothetical protein